MNVLEVAAKYGFRIRDGRNNQKTFCPKCSSSRRNKFDRCLSVRIDQTGIGWRCFNCNWSGGEMTGAKRASFTMAGQSQNRVGDRDPYGALLRVARPGWVGHAGR
jgi:hypothetical protein